MPAVQTMAPETADRVVQAGPHDLLFREPDLGFRMEQDAQLRGRALAVSHVFGKSRFLVLLLENKLGALRPVAARPPWDKAVPKRAERTNRTQPATRVSESCRQAKPLFRVSSSTFHSCKFHHFSGFSVVPTGAIFRVTQIMAPVFGKTSWPLFVSQTEHLG